MCVARWRSQECVFMACLQNEVISRCESAWGGRMWNPVELGFQALVKDSVTQISDGIQLIQHFATDMCVYASGLCVFVCVCVCLSVSVRVCVWCTCRPISLHVPEHLTSGAFLHLSSGSLIVAIRGHLSECWWWAGVFWQLLPQDADILLPEIFRAFTDTSTTRFLRWAKYFPCLFPVLWSTSTHLRAPQWPSHVLTFTSVHICWFSSEQHWGQTCNYSLEKDISLYLSQ